MASHEGSHSDSASYTAALERALHETLLALVALSQEKQELRERLVAIRQLTIRHGASGLREIHHILSDVPD